MGLAIRYMSDLHLEVGGRDHWELPQLAGDSESVLVLAGDIDVDKQAVRLTKSLARRFRAVVQIAGNHEYYKAGSPVRLPTKLKQLLADVPNAYFLENGSVDIAGVRFIGATMWADFNDADDEARRDAELWLNDFNRIRFGSTRAPYFRKFPALDAMRLHIASRDYIRRAVLDAHAAGLQAVVVTHHAPFVPASQPDSPHPDVLRFAYGTDLSALIRETKPVAWIFGHLHKCIDRQLHETRLLANCRGYEGIELVDGFDATRRIILGPAELEVCGWPVEVMSIAKEGVWLRAHSREMFLAYQNFPWFRDQPERAIKNVEVPSPGRYRWPELDVDLTDEIIEHPEQFPFVARNTE